MNSLLPIESVKLPSRESFHPNLLNRVDCYRIDANRKLSIKSRSALGQFMTQAAIGKFMASLFENTQNNICLADPGAGIGSLTASFVQEVIKRGSTPKKIHVDAFEIEEAFFEYLNFALTECAQSGAISQADFSSQIIKEDFIKFGVKALWANYGNRYTHCIMNPPYKKIRRNSEHHFLLEKIGVGTTNLYTAFLAIAIKLLKPDGELVAIVPRSFCNGVYFKSFRKFLFEEMALTRLHVFNKRNEAFKEDSVLQENIIFHAKKGVKQKSVAITSSSDSTLSDMTYRDVKFDKVVRPTDPDKFIHLVVTDFDQMVVDRINVFFHSLKDLEIDVKTGPIVDFRLRSDILKHAKDSSCPLIYAGHFTDNYVVWPKPNLKKSNAILPSEKSEKFLMPNDWYVVTKRFSAKEERKRIVAAIHDPNRVPGESIGFENHLNVFHKKNKGLNPKIAKGLALYLNSTLIDLYFRQFSGHTQVNATDLRMIHFPDLNTLSNLGSRIGEVFPKQKDVDKILDTEIENMGKEKNDINPLNINDKIQEALSILKSLKLPRGQQNERSALTLLALLDLKPNDQWSNSSAPLIGITPIMDFAKNNYGKTYAPNTRETFRRQTMHQFMDAGIAIANPDLPERPINSPKWCYQIEQNALLLIQSFGAKKWKPNLTVYRKKQKSLAERYANEREMQMLPLTLNGGLEITLTPGDHSNLIKEIIHEFGPRYAPGSIVLYVGDTGSKLGHFDTATFKKLGLKFDSHGKFPDVVLYYKKKNWLLLIEAVTSHGPVDAKRHSELSSLFSNSKAGIVYVTAFPNRQIMARYLSEISWETEVWVSESPSHIIHFNGERFLGPYEENK